MQSILFMIGPVQHNLTKWLAVLNIYTENYKDSFAFANYMQNCSFNSDDKFMCSFDISNLLCFASGNRHLC